MAAARPASGIVVPLPLPWHRRLAAVAAAGLFRVCFKTWSFRWQHPGASPEAIGPVIFCVWHNRFISGMASYDEFARSRWPSKGLAAMISASRDGSLVADVAERFGVHAIR